METETKNIADKIMLVRLSIHQWYPTKLDKKAAADLAALHNVDPERLGKVLKNLVDLESIRPLQQSYRKLRNNFHDMTAPWDDGGIRAATAEIYYNLCQQLHDDIEACEILADAYQAEYTIQIEKAKVVLNGLYNEDDYPAPHVMRARFSVDYDFKPVTNVEDIRCWGLGAEAQKQIEDTVSRQVNEKVQAAQKHVFDKVVQRAHEFIEKITKFDDEMAASENDGKGLRLYDSAVGNLRDIILLVLEGMNFTGDQEIETLCKQLNKTLKNVNTTKLKISTDMRKKTMADVEQLLEKFEGVF